MTGAVDYRAERRGEEADVRAVLADASPHDPAVPELVDALRASPLRIPEAAFQVIRQPSHEAWMTGTLVYPQAFWDLDCVGLRDTDG